MTAYGIALTMVIVGAFGLGWHFGRAALTRRLDRLYRARIAPVEDYEWPETKMIHPIVAVLYDETKTVEVGQALYDQEQERG